MFTTAYLIFKILLSGGQVRFKELISLLPKKQLSGDSCPVVMAEQQPAGYVSM